MAPIIANWVATSRNVIHFGLVLSRLGVILFIRLDTANAKMKHNAPTHATPPIRTKCIIYFRERI